MKNASEGLRLLADWFDTEYLDGLVQNDLRRWANQYEKIEILLDIFEDIKYRKIDVTEESIDKTVSIVYELIEERNN